jgi:nucleoid-associated protein YgaU
MTRENKLVMIVGFGFLLFLGILVSDHLAANTTPLKQELVRYTPEPRALPGENERFGTKPIPVAPPGLPVDEQGGIRIAQAETAMMQGANGNHGIVGTPVIDGARTTATSKERVHKVAKGEHPGDIAKKYYGKSSLGVKLAEYNRIDPKTLRIGQELKVPDVAVLDPSLAPKPDTTVVADFGGGAFSQTPPNSTQSINTQASNTQASNTQAMNGLGATLPNNPGMSAGVGQQPVAPLASTSENGKFGTVKVREGDNLYRIAAKVYGDGSRWEEIARLNGLGEGRKLKPGMEIKYALAN